MTQNLISQVVLAMRGHLDNVQAKALQNTLETVLAQYDISLKADAQQVDDDERLVSAFLAAKQT